MSDDPIKLRFVYLTLPVQDHPILNINVQKFHYRFEVSRDQLYDLNKQIADILVKGNISDKHSFNEQLVLNLEKAATL